MKLLPFAISATIILLTSAPSYAGHGYLNSLLRNCGYGYSDGYHAQRYCLSDYSKCSDCSPVQQPMMQQPMMPEPMMYQGMMPRPMVQQVMMPQQPVLRQPMRAPGYPQWSPHQFQQASYPVGYPVAQPYQPWHQPYAPGYGQPVTPTVAIPNRTPAAPW